MNARSRCDQNGKRLTRNLCRSTDGSWGVTVWWGGANGLGTDARRYYYASRKAARAACITDEIGRNGRVG